MSINFSTLQGLTIPQGVVTQVADAAGNVLWAVSGWPDDLDTGLEFVSASAFTISVSRQWDGTMEYCNGEGWQTWIGGKISSGETEKGHCIYVRGTGNTKIITSSSFPWTFTGSNIECNGNIEKLLDYATVMAGKHPTMGTKCFQYMFSGCTSLITAPSLPATTLAEYCYYHMFKRCINLITAPSLPATTLAPLCYSYMFYGCSKLTGVPSLPATTLVNRCYNSMFYNCKKIKVSSTASGTYKKAYRIPYSGTGTDDGSSNPTALMFVGTGGTFTGAPTINTTYYLDSSNTIV